jgi:transposase
VIQMDQASAHRAHEIDWPENVIPLFQPAYIPEVNPIERFWKQLKTPLQGETFKNLKALRQRVQTVLSEMTEDVVRSVTGWKFITDAVLSVSSN